VLRLGDVQQLDENFGDVTIRFSRGGLRLVRVKSIKEKFNGNSFWYLNPKYRLVTCSTPYPKAIR